VLGRHVAIKALLPHLAERAEDRTRFLEEARALATLKHPNIVEVHDVGEAAGRPFFAMELVEGQPLERITLHRRPLPLQRALLMVRDIASALDEIHRAGYVHRDLKPANVMVTPDGHAKLTDFGIALAAGHPRLTHGYGLGTAEYASPEQIDGKYVGPPADIYALGVLTFELLAGSPPFTGDLTHVVYAQAHTQPPSLSSRRPDLPDSVFRAVYRALSKDPARRPHTAQEFVELLESNKSPAPPKPRPRAPRPAETPVVPQGPRPDFVVFGQRIAATVVDTVLSIFDRTSSSSVNE
jgi:serine/threonine-protein kinase